MTTRFNTQGIHDLSTLVFLIQAYIEKGNKYKAYKELENVKKFNDIPPEITKALSFIIEES